jgi:phosphoribosylaminoimidazole (AIR) synthetase
MVLVLARDDVAAARAVLEREGETVFEIGAIEKSSGEPDAVIV